MGESTNYDELNANQRRRWVKLAIKYYREKGDHSHLKEMSKSPNSQIASMAQEVLEKL